jgi:anaerobic selenocysteine-containing dehydrogenase
MHPDDAGSLSSGARVRVKSAHGSVDAELAVSDSIAPGVVSLPHGFGDVGLLRGPNVNALTGDVEPLLGTSILSGVPVSVQAHGGDGAEAFVIERK